MATPLTAAKALAALKAEGIQVREYKDWEKHNRNHKGKWGPVHGVMLHHTANTSDSGAVSLCYNGRSDLPGPLCHGVGETTGRLTMVGWGRANHAGLGDDDVLKAVIAERALPTDNEANTDGNSRFYGLEIVNAGNGDDHYQAAQYETAIKFATALCRAHKWGHESVICHKEWQPGKIDPKGPITGHGEFTPARARADVKAALALPAGKWKLNAPAPSKPKAPTIVPKSRESAATMKAQAERALRDWPFIPEVEKKYGLTPGLLLAVGSRETNLVNKVGDGGHGHGVWQQDDRWWKVPAGFDQDVRAQAEKAGDMLADNYAALKDWSAAIAAYNAGVTGVKSALAAGKSADSATTGGDYAADVLGRQIQMKGAAPARVLEFLPVSGYMPELRHGDENWYVDWLQRNLNRFLKTNIKVDGKYGTATAAAVHAFYKQELGYTTTTGGRVFGADGWRRVLSVAKDNKGNNT